MKIGWSFKVHGKNEYEDRKWEGDVQRFAGMCVEAYLDDAKIQRATGNDQGEGILKKILEVPETSHLVCHTSVLIHVYARLGVGFFYLVCVWDRVANTTTPVLFFRKADTLQCKWWCASEDLKMTAREVETMVKGVVIKHDEPIWPLVAFLPEEFEDVMKLRKLLTASEDNPLTGLLASRTTEVRTLANQIRLALEFHYNNWVRSILAAI